MGSSWEVRRVDALSAELLDAIFDGEIAGVRIPGFVGPEACSAASAAVQANGFDYYETVDPPLGRIGIAQYDHRTDKPTYFRLAAAAHETRQRIFAAAGDPVALVIDALGAAWPDKVGLATEDAYGAYFAGIVRVTIGGIRTHCDWGPQDAPGWLIDSVTGQLAWNIFYDLSSSGGQTTVYDRPWVPELEDHADPAAFGFYQPTAVEGRARSEISPGRGELVVFSSRNLHSVAPATGTGTRLSASSFVGRLPGGELALWS
ncbi:MAG TPA: 2OG-Fe(II) oxygenase [Pseudonocardiaceae bacterium]|nr:2OG-Fe(II) oxygenase [Pseudonocardiaceae bacterium]